MRIMERIDLAENDREREDAAFKMIIDALDRDRDERRKVKKLCIICASLCIIALLSFGSILAVLASGIQIDQSTVTEETTQTVEGDNATINNGQWDQFNDNAVNGGG